MQLGGTNLINTNPMMRTAQTRGGANQPFSFGDFDGGYFPRDQAVGTGGSSWEGSTWGDPPGGLQFLAINNNQGYNGPPGRGPSGGGPPGRGLPGGDPPGGPQFPVINTNKGHNNQMGGQFDTLAASMYLGSYKPKGTPFFCS